MTPSTFPFASAPMMQALQGMGCVLFHRLQDADGRLRYPWLGDNAPDMFGLSADRLHSNNPCGLNGIHWADRDLYGQAIAHSAQHMVPSHECFRIITGAGETRWLQGSAVPVAQPGGQILWHGAWFDISDWRRAEHQFQTVMDHAEDCILTLDADTGIEWANAAAERLFGWTLEELRGQPLSLLVDQSTLHPEAEMESGFTSLPHRVQAFHRGGQGFPFEMTISEVRSDGKLSLIVIGRDITQRCLTEAQLEETEYRLHSMAGNLPGIMFQRVLSPHGEVSYAYVSEGTHEILGLSPHDILHNPSCLHQVMVPEDHARLIEEMQVSAETLDPMDEDIRITGRDGRLHWLSGQSRPRRRGGDIVWDGVVLDVTDEVEERIKAERAIRSSEERFRLVVAAATVGIVVTSLEGVILHFNPAFQRMCHMPDANLLGASLEQFVDPLHLPSVADLPAPGGSVCFEYQPHMPDGSERRWRLTLAQFSLSEQESRACLLFLIDDITDIVEAVEGRHQLELALNEGQKLEALGRLAGGVAHELNNMLGPILMGADMLLRTGKLDEKNRERCQRIIEASKHGRDIVRNVLAYCRKEQKKAAPIDLAETFRQFISLISCVMPPSIRVSSQCECASLTVMGDAGQLTQVLLNLANNARDAMDGQGSLSISLGLRRGEDFEAKNPQRPRGPMKPGEGFTDDFTPGPFAGLQPGQDYADIQIRDSGCGMRPEVIDRIFDPFFTTKPVGQGTGLGLSVVQGIINSMGGMIGVDSQPGQGTSFRIAIPVL